MLIDRNQRKRVVVHWISHPETLAFGSYPMVIETPDSQHVVVGKTEHLSQGETVFVVAFPDREISQFICKIMIPVCEVEQHFG